MPKLEFYKTIICGDEVVEEIRNDDKEDEDECCDCLETDCTSLHI